MKTLVTNAANNYLKSGVIPRIFVSIPEANLLLGTQIFGSYEDSLKSCGTITHSIEPFGGMAKVSGVEIANLELGDNVTFCSTEDVSPLGEGTEPKGAGRIIKRGDTGDSYATVRGASTGDFGTPSVAVGQKYYPGEDQYYTYRGCMQFEIPSELNTCEDAAIAIYGSADMSDTDFEIYVIEGTWDTWKTGEIYKSFDGWKSGDTAYDDSETDGSPKLNETWHTHSFSVSASTPNYIRLNLIGRELIESKKGSTLKLLLLSKRDFEATTPTGDEFVKFKVDDIKLKLRYNTDILYNKEAIVYLAFADSGNSLSGLSDVSDMQRIWTGVVDDYSINEYTLNLSLRQNNFKKNIVIPRSIINVDDFSDCPEENIGKPYPIVYGDFTTSSADLKHDNGIGYFEANASYSFPSYQFGYTTNFLKGLVVQKTHPKKVLLSETCMKDKANPYYLMNKSRGKYEILAVEPSTDTPSDEEVIETLNVPELYFPGDLIINNYNPVQTVLPSKIDTYGSPTNPERAYDSDPNNYAEYSALNDTIYFYFDDVLNVPIGRWFSIVCYVSYEGGAADPSLQVELQYSKDGGSTWNNWDYGIDYANLSSGQNYWRKGFNASSTFMITSFSQIRFYIWRNSVSGGGTCRLYNVCIVSSYGSSEYTFVSTSGQGRYAEDATIAPIDTLYENPSHIIESIGRDEMGLDSDSLNETLFDAAVTDLSGWKMAFQILDRKDTSKILDELAKQSKSRLYWDEQDKLAIKVFDEDESFPNANSLTGNVPDDLDIFDEDADISDNIFSQHPILESGEGVVPFELFKMGADETKNDFVLYYKKNYATGEYEKNLYITNGAGVEADVETNITEAYLENGQDLSSTGNLKQLCADCYNELSTTNTWEYKADYIRDDATANKLLQHYVERLTKNRWKVRFTTGLNGIAHDVGDLINVRHHRIRGIFGTPTTNVKKWEIIKIDFDLENYNIVIEAIEV